jgi:hypothetical protein
MTSNTKLSPDQKAILREMLNDACLNRVHVVNLDDVTTMAYQDNGQTVKFSLAVMAEDEKKFRAKVGQYHALTRFLHCDQYVTMNRTDFAVMCDYVWDFYPF